MRHENNAAAVERQLVTLPGPMKEKEMKQRRMVPVREAVAHRPGWMPLLAVVQLVLWAGLFLHSEQLLRHFDPTTGVLLDISVLNTVFLALLMLHLVVV